MEHNCQPNVKLNFAKDFRVNFFIHTIVLKNFASYSFALAVCKINFCAKLWNSARKLLCKQVCAELCKIYLLSTCVDITVVAYSNMAESVPYSVHIYIIYLCLDNFISRPWYCWKCIVQCTYSIMYFCLDNCSRRPYIAENVLYSVYISIMYLCLDNCSSRPWYC